jgi:membrane-associated protease RseP (regulator of RpoE activity)
VAANGYVVAAFYIAIIAAIYYYRDVFEFEGIVALYKAKWGLRLMDRVANASPGLVRAFSITGIAAGYLVMALMLWLVWFSVQNLIYRPDAPAAFTPILPGVDIPGSQISFPLIEPIIAIFVVVVIHEFAHGVVARRYDIDVNSSGFVLFGPIPGAFVEPDEEQLEQASQETCQGLFGAGPWSNILFAVPIFFLVAGGIAAADAAYQGDGATINRLVTGNSTERLDGLQEGDTITGLNDESVESRVDLIGALQNRSVNETVTVTTMNDTHTVQLGEPPGGGESGFLGVSVQTKYAPANTSAASWITPVESAYFWVMGDFRGYVTTPWIWPAVNVFSPSFNGQTGLLAWIFIVSTGIAGANLLPIGPLDGGRMLYKSLRGVFPDRVATRISSVITWTLLVVVLALVFVPMIRPFI